MSYLSTMPEMAFLISLILLILSAELIIENSEIVGYNIGISPFIIGVTVLALGTSLPELSTSIQAILEEKNTFPIDNVLGSNITNISLIGGIILMLSYQENKINKKSIGILVLFLLTTISFFLMIEIGHISVVFLLFVAVLYAVVVIFGNEEVIYQNNIQLKNNIIGNVFWIGAGLFGLTYGGSLVVKSVGDIAFKYQLTETYVTIVMVALGTSLPELVLSVVAVLKNNVKMAIGNILGSNILNVLVVIGVTQSIGNLEISEEVSQHNYVLLFMTLNFAIGIFTPNNTKSKVIGLALMLTYIYFLWIL